MDVAEQLYAEVAPDCAWLRCSAKRPGWKRGPALRASHRVAHRDVRWLDWFDVPTLTNEMSRLSRTASAWPLVSMQFDPFPEDEFRFRVRSYANFIYPSIGVFRVD